MLNEFKTCFLLVCVLIALPASAGMYKWYDEEGNTHYTQLPPPPGARRASISSHINAVKSEEKPASQQPNQSVQENYNSYSGRSRQYRPSKKTGSTASSAESEIRIREWRRQQYRKKINKIRNGKYHHSGTATGR
jgi:hypothetical protein